MAAQRHPCPSDGGAGAARVGADGSSGHVTALRAMPKASPAYVSENVRAHGGEVAEDMSSRQRTNLFRRWRGGTFGRPALGPCFRRDDGGREGVGPCFRDDQKKTACRSMPFRKCALKGARQIVAMPSGRLAPTKCFSQQA